MREFRFRGQHIETDEWIYGDLIQNGFDGKYTFLKGIKQDFLPVIAVDQDTVGQLIGRKDVNKKDIYEGDIVKWGMFKNSEECFHRYAKVVIDPDIQFEILFYINAKTGKRKKGDGYIFHFGRFAYKNTEDHLEIVGNIHENPELLEKTLTKPE